MNEASVLGQVALGYCPMIDRQRSIMATRLTVFPLRPTAAPDAGELLQRAGLKSGQPTAHKCWPEHRHEGLLRDSLAPNRART